MKKKNESKSKHRVLRFSHKQEEKSPFNNLTRNKTSRYGVFFSLDLILLISVFRNFNILDICSDKIAGKSAKHSQFKI